MSFLLWKMQSKVSSACSVVGINALVWKICRWWSLLWVCEKMWESCRKAHLHPRDCASSLPALQRSFNISFPFQPLSAHQDGSRARLRAHPMRCWRRAQTPVWSPHPDGPQSELGHQVLWRGLRGALRTPLPGLCSAPPVLLSLTHPCSYRLLQTCLACTGMWKHGQGHVRSVAKDTARRSQLCPPPPLPAVFVSAHNVLISLQEGMSFSGSYVSRIPPPVTESNCVHVQSTWTYQAQLTPAVRPLLSGKSEQG